MLTGPFVFRYTWKCLVWPWRPSSTQDMLSTLCFARWTSASPSFTEASFIGMWNGDNRKKHMCFSNKALAHLFWAAVSLWLSSVVVILRYKRTASPAPLMWGFSCEGAVSRGEAILGSLWRATVLVTSQLLRDWVSKSPALAGNAGTCLSATAQYLLQAHLHLHCLYPHWGLIGCILLFVWEIGFSQLSIKPISLTSGSTNSSKWLEPHWKVIMQINQPCSCLCGICLAPQQRAAKGSSDPDPQKRPQNWVQLLVQGSGVTSECFQPSVNTSWANSLLKVDSVGLQVKL